MSDHRNTFDNQIKQAFENYEVTPPPGNKEIIFRKLDGKGGRRIIVFWATAIILLLITTSAIVYYGFDFSSSPKLSNSEEPVLNNLSVEPESNSPDNTNSMGKNTTSVTEEDKIEIEFPVQNMLVPNNEILKPDHQPKTEDFEKQVPDIDQEKKLFVEINSGPQLVHGGDEKVISITSIHTIKNPMDEMESPLHSMVIKKLPEENYSIDLKGFHLGISGKSSSTWILIHQIGSKELVPFDYYPSIGKSGGVTFGYNFNNSFGIHTEINNAEYVQEWADDYQTQNPTNLRATEAVNYTKLKLTYTSIPLLAEFKRYRHSSMLRMPVVTNYQVGIQYETIQSAIYTSNSRDTDAINHFKKEVIGIAGGIVVDFFLTNHLNLSLGWRGSYARNISTSPLIDRSIEERVNNISFGLHLGLGWQF